jgi:hypothetical protein
MVMRMASLTSTNAGPEVITTSSGKRHARSTPAVIAVSIDVRRWSEDCRSQRRWGATCELIVDLCG